MSANPIQKIKDNWQVLATLLIAWSLFDLYNFYSPFGIEIQSFLSISEIFLLVFPTILNGVFAILIITFFLAFGSKTRTDGTLVNDTSDDSLLGLKESWNDLRKNFPLNKVGNWFGLIINIIGLVMKLGVLAFVGFIVYVVISLFTSTNVQLSPMPKGVRFSMLMFLSMFLLIPLFMAINAFLTGHKYPLFARLTLVKSPFVYFALGFIINSLISNRLQYLNITNGYGDYKLSFMIQDKTIKTDSNLVYIGSTQSYIFIYDNKDSTSLCYKKESMSNLSIRKMPVVKLNQK